MSGKLHYASVDVLAVLAASSDKIHPSKIIRGPVADQQFCKVPNLKTEQTLMLIRADQRKIPSLSEESWRADCRLSFDDMQKRTFSLGKYLACQLGNGCHAGI